MTGLIAGVKSRYYRVNYRTKLFLAFLTFIIVPIAILSIYYYFLSSTVVSEISSKYLFEIVKRNNNVMDEKMKKIEESSTAIMGDRELFNIFSTMDMSDDYSIISANREITEIISKYFPNQEELTVSIITKRYLFGESQLFDYNLYDSYIYREARKSNGSLIWIPTYKISDILKDSPSKQLDEYYGKIFSCIKMMNLFYVDNGEVKKFKGTINPALIISFREDMYTNNFYNSLPAEGIDYYVVSPDNRIVSSSTGDSGKPKVNLGQIQNVIKGDSGIRNIRTGGTQNIICYDKSQITGWTSVVIINKDQLVSKIVKNIIKMIVYISIPLIIIALIMGYLFSMQIAKPIRKIIAAIKKTGSGNFQYKLSTVGFWEFDNLIDRYNSMNDRISELITENYTRKICQKEAEIKVLNLQLNPHFLYNTLSLINCIALENKQAEVSQLIVSLSKMLYYTAQNDQEMGSVIDEINWLKNYIFIMSKRYMGKILFHCDIDPALCSTQAPRLFLQPFVENVFKHGYDDLKEVMEIKIKGWTKKGKRFFWIKDNGKGMSEVRLGEIFNPENTASLGIKNVDKRIKLIYGEEYGVRIRSKEKMGTRVMITIPL